MPEHDAASSITGSASLHSNRRPVSATCFRSRTDDGTAVTRGAALQELPTIPGLVKPDAERLWLMREIDLGPRGEQGIGRYPAEEGRTYPCYVSAVDADGNEAAGIRLPDLDAPVGTHTGWNTRAAETGAPEQLIPMQGWTLFFPPTKSAREQTGDDRLSLQERYAGREEYLARVRELAQKLVDDRYLLAEDIGIVVEACAERYDTALMAGA